MEVDQDTVMGMLRFGSGVAWVAEQFAIRQWPSARIDWEIMSHEDHASIQLRAVAAGLRSVHRQRPGIHDAEIRAVQAARLKALEQG